MRCNLCNSENTTIFKREIIDESERINWGEYDCQTWFLCKECGNLFPFPNTPLKVVADIWNNSRKLYDDEFIKKHQIYLDKVSENIIGKYWKYISNKKYVLDIGCGYGNLIKLLQKKGFTTLGIDVDKSTKKYHDLCHLNTLIGSVEDVPIGRKFDVIFLNYSIYFIVNIEEFLVKCKKMLNQDGIICITMADFLHSSNKELPGKSHSFYPVKESIEILMDRCGFCKKYVLCDKGSIYMVFELGNRETSISKYTIWKIMMLYKTKKFRYMLYYPITLAKKIIKNLFLSLR